MDFGIVLELQSDTLTRPGMMVGSPSYLSPEQVVGDTITPRSDIFLLGICLYEMLTGTRPFRDEEGETIFQRIRETKFIPVRKLRPRTPAALDRMVRTCLQKDPDRRYHSAKEVIQELENFLGPSRSSRPEDVILKYLEDEALITPSVPVSSDLPSTKRGRSWGALARGIGAVAMLAATFFAGYRYGRFYAIVWSTPSKIVFPPARPVQSLPTKPPAKKH